MSKQLRWPQERKLGSTRHTSSRYVIRCVSLGALLLTVRLQAQQDEAKVQTIYAAAKTAQSNGDLAGAIAEYKRLVQVSPKLAPAYSNLGMLYVRTRQYPEAITALKHARALDPTLPTTAPLLGIAYFETADYVQAKAVLEVAVKANPKDENAASLLARTLLRTGDLAAAAQQLQQLATREPDNQQLWFQLGQAYMQLSQEAFHKVETIDPNSVLVHQLAGQMMLDMHNYDGALVEARKAVEMAPNQAGTHYGLGMVYWNQNNLPAALAEFQSELRNDPTNCDAHAKIGNILLAQQQPEEALNEANHALASCSGLLQARVVRGEALVQEGKNTEAVPALREVLVTDPDNESAHFYLARAYRALGDKASAEAELSIYARLEAAAREHTAAEAHEVNRTKTEP